MFTAEQAMEYASNDMALDPKNWSVSTQLIDAYQMLPLNAKMNLLQGFKRAVIWRKPDVVIGSSGNPYMERWWLVPRRKYAFNVYVHRFLRSDDDRALHDHPANNVSILIEGSYLEHTPTGVFERKAGDLVVRGAEYLHRIELHNGFEDLGHGNVVDAPIPVWSLFITGPKIRDWGFACPNGWTPWQKFTGQNEDNGPVTSYDQPGPGCD